MVVERLIIEKKIEDKANTYKHAHVCAHPSADVRALKGFQNQNYLNLTDEGWIEIYFLTKNITLKLHYMMTQMNGSYMPKPYALVMTQAIKPQLRHRHLETSLWGLSIFIELIFQA